MSNICQKCKKTRATVHLTEIDPQNNEPHEMHLCESCAQETGASTHKMAFPTSAVTIATSILGFTEKVGAKRSSPIRTVECPECHMTYQDFRVKGRFGCAGCYDAFSEGLLPLLEKVHGATEYVGPRPNEAAPASGPKSSVVFEKELLDLRRRLNAVVKDEDYEEAARIRDRIQEVEQILSEYRDV